MDGVNGKRSKRTPVSQCRNLGQISERELNSIGIDSLEEIKAQGWEQVCEKYIFFYPERLNLNMITSIIRAVYDQDWRKLNPNLKEQARKFLKSMNCV